MRGGRGFRRGAARRRGVHPSRIAVPDAGMRRAATGEAGVCRVAGFETAAQGVGCTASYSRNEGRAAYIAPTTAARRRDRKRVVEGKSGSIGGDLGGSRMIKKKKYKRTYSQNIHE